MQATRRAAVYLLLAVAYAVVVLPVGLVARLIRDPLRRRPDASAGSYWSAPPRTGAAEGRYAAPR
ncbi:hypothetical protein Drose_14715 [Dactylosporangium roseum]|uniref:Uncharacterized protein n=1 Tax=Dactylosporangium roseum TaxID=47989 RepID=A0ABY5ZF47_9ACTN|nr:hypothetical protein [Dactylosporangium roseum]UWZ39372.1 hypothetical protein Drose_14715 [Dactylosporangium roseum]